MVLNDLLAIKRRREDAAVAALAAAQRALAERQAAFEAKTRELADYRVWQAEEKTRRFEKVHGRNITKRGLTEYREQLGLMRQRQLGLEEELAEAERAVAAARSELERARRMRAEANAEVVKLEDYQGVLDREQQRAAERKENDEADEFRVRPPAGTVGPWNER